jgi:hypothetical protein
MEQEIRGYLATTPLAKMVDPMSFLKELETADAG